MDRDDAILLHRLSLAAAGRQDLPDALIVLPLAVLPDGLPCRATGLAPDGMGEVVLVTASDLGDWLASGAGPPADGGFGGELRRIREARRLPQRTLGRAAGVDHSRVSRWESGVRSPSARQLGRAAVALGLDDAGCGRLLRLLAREGDR
jgi:Helix-turn-helix domain